MAKDFNKEMKETIDNVLEQVNMMNYQGQLKGILFIIIDNENRFGFKEAYASQHLLQMGAGLDVAKDRVKTMIMSHLEQGKEWN